MLRADNTAPPAAGRAAPPTHEDAIAAVRAAAERIRAGSGARDGSRTLPRDEVRELAAAGAFLLTVPTERGGPGLPSSAVVEALLSVAVADPNLAQIGQNHYAALQALPRLRFPEPVQERIFADVARGSVLATVGAERAGKTALTFTATLRRGEDGVQRVNGTKFYSTGAFASSWMLTNGIEPGGGMLMAFVESNSPGVEIDDDWSGFGQRTTGSGTTRLVEVAVPDEFVVPFTFSPDNPVSPLGQAIHAAIQVGVARAALEDGMAFAREKARPWVDVEAYGGVDPFVLEQVGALSARVRAAEALLRETAALLDAYDAEPGPDRFLDAQIAAAQVKSLGAAVALEVSTGLFALTGSRGTLAEHGLDRHWRNSRTHSLHAPARWTDHHVGNWLLSGVRPPQNGHI